MLSRFSFLLFCAPGWTQFEDYEYRLLGDGDKLVFAEAQAECEIEGANLASVVDQPEQDFLAVWLFDTAPVNQIWIGGEVTSDGNFTLSWTDGSRTDMLSRPWIPGQPNLDGLGGQCVFFVIRDDTGFVGGWQLRRCLAERAYGNVYEIGGPAVLRVKWLGEG